MSAARLSGNSIGSIIKTTRIPKTPPQIDPSKSLDIVLIVRPFLYFWFVCHLMILQGTRNLHFLQFVRVKLSKPNWLRQSAQFSSFFYINFMMHNRLLNFQLVIKKHNFDSLNVSCFVVITNGQARNAGKDF